MSEERFGWHADGDPCFGSECGNIDEATGDHSPEGFAEHGRRFPLSREAEAVAQERARIRAAVEGLPGYIEQRGRGELVEYVVLRAAVLAIIEGETL